MERKSQSAPARLITRYRKQLPYINFYRFCQLLEQSLPDQLPIGSGWQARQEAVRFCPYPGMGFPASEIKDAVIPEESHLPPTVHVTFMGLYGVTSPLPAHYISDIAQQREGHEAAADFLDIFSHRLITQYYRIWRKYSYYSFQHRRAARYRAGYRAGSCILICWRCCTFIWAAVWMYVCNFVLSVHCYRMPGSVADRQPVVRNWGARQ